MSTDWMQHAACRGKDANMFVPLPSATNQVAAAIAICRTCPVINDCAADAKATGATEGIRGGELLGYPSRAGIDTRRLGRRLARGAS